MFHIFLTGITVTWESSFNDSSFPPHQNCGEHIGRFLLVVAGLNSLRSVREFCCAIPYLACFYGFSRVTEAVMQCRIVYASRTQPCYFCLREMHFGI